MRFSIVGTTAITSTRWRSISASVSSASNARAAARPCSRAPVAIVNWPRPCAWKSGAGIRHAEPASIGTTLRNQASGSRPAARAIRAPFGGAGRAGGQDHHPALLGAAGRRGVVELLVAQRS